MLPTSSAVTHLFGHEPLPRASEPDLETFALMQGFACPEFEFVLADVSEYCRGGNKQERIRDAFERFRALAQYDQRFAVHCFGSLLTRRDNDQRGFLLFRKMDGYRKVYFTRNFFPWLLDRGNGTSIGGLDKLVYISHDVASGIIVDVMGDRGTSNAERTYLTLRPQTRFADLQFTTNDFARLCTSIDDDYRPMPREWACVADCIDTIAREHRL